MSVLIDSSVWVDYLRCGEPDLSDRIDEMLDADTVYANGTVLGEVLYGAKSPEAFNALRETFRGLHLLDDTCEIFVRAAEVGCELRSDGITVPLTDIVIAIQCRENALRLLTRDRHFEMIGRQTDLEFELLRNYDRRE
jgi:hypothetical protein